jgi:hypothetical protein
MGAIYNPGSGGGVSSTELKNSTYAYGLPGVAASSVPFGQLQVSETLIAKKLYMSRFVVPTAMSFKKAKFLCTNASTKDNGVAISVYAADGKTRIATTAKTQELMLASGVKSIALEWTATPGTVYYASFIAEEATPEAGTVGKVSAVGPSLGSGNEMFGTTPPNKLAMAATGIVVPPPSELSEVPANTQTAVPLVFFTTE